MTYEDQVLFAMQGKRDYDNELRRLFPNALFVEESETESSILIDLSGEDL